MVRLATLLTPVLCFGKKTPQPGAKFTAAALRLLQIKSTPHIPVNQHVWQDNPARLAVVLGIDLVGFGDLQIFGGEEGPRLIRAANLDAVQITDSPTVIRR